MIPKIINQPKTSSWQSYCADDTLCRQPSQVLSSLYGTFVITEPVLLDLFSCPSVLRLQHINQYGADFFVGSKKRFSRYDHSMGVLCLLRMVNAPLLEQIAGLLHDVSHTVFSHTGDVVFDHVSSMGSYQDDIHEWFLQQTEIPEILAKYNIDTQDILHKNPAFKALEQDLPELCADRLDYNMFGAVLDFLLMPQEITHVISHLNFADGRWFFTDHHSAKKIAYIPLHLTEFHFSSARDSLLNHYMGEMLKYALALGLLSHEDIHFSSDAIVWNILKCSHDITIRRFIDRLEHLPPVTLGDETHHDIWMPAKSRGIDPWILINDELVRLSAIDEEFHKEYSRVKKIMERGWYIKFF
jgi:hypothetical protein